MSEGKLCGAKLLISTKINSENTIEVCCDQYEGHDGNHTQEFYRCIKVKSRPNFPDNHRLGKIEWNDTLTANEKQ